MDGHRAFGHVLLRQVGAHDPAGVPVGGGHVLRGALQVGKADGAAFPALHHGLQHRVGDQRVAFEAERLDGDGGTFRQRQHRRFGHLQRGGARRQLRLVVLVVELLAQGAGVGNGLRERRQHAGGTGQQEDSDYGRAHGSSLDGIDSREVRTWGRSQSPEVTD